MICLKEWKCGEKFSRSIDGGQWAETGLGPGPARGWLMEWKQLMDHQPLLQWQRGAARGGHLCGSFASCSRYYSWMSGIAGTEDETAARSMEGR